METTKQSETQFKTNIQCGSCIATVTPFLDKTVGAQHWQVDTASPNKVLTIQADGVSAEQIQQAVQQAGYKAELLG